MYELKQAAVLAYENLSTLLKKAGYTPIIGSLGIWTHKTRKTIFCLCVDDFGVKYYKKEDLIHLKNAIESVYTCKVDWEGKNFLGFTLDWNYDRGFVDISMPDYVRKSLKKLQYKKKVYPQYSPHEYTATKYSKKGSVQYAQKEDNTPLLSPQKTSYVQSVVGTFLYYARAIDSTMLPALNQIGSQQSLPTKHVLEKIQRLMDYANTYPNAYVRFYASDMQLTVDSDAAFLVLPKARSRIAGYFRLIKNSSSPIYTDNGAILIECRTLRNVVTSAAEAETHGVFHNAKTGLPIQHLLQSMGHPQKPFLIKTDNSTSAGYVNNNMQMKKSKTWDMYLHWLRNKENKKNFKVQWDKGSNNDADYFTKHHPTIHHRKLRSKFVRDLLSEVTNEILTLSVCTSRESEGMLIRYIILFLSSIYLYIHVTS